MALYYGRGIYEGKKKLVYAKEERKKNCMNCTEKIRGVCWRLPDGKRRTGRPRKNALQLSNEVNSREEPCELEREYEKQTVVKKIN
ncbi:hypothetical protein WA026_022374 [Henosepilachna vigintioctopunctata]|uniref:Uncharacterized protein n=1 Tax=Henosepilachna vigintioctopunctata TaxID=420089 RepID=A0AAW1V3Y5_9CUCU